MDIGEARKTMREAFEKYPEFKVAYIGIVAMELRSIDCLYSIEKRNLIAEAIIDTIFTESIIDFKLR